MKVLEDYEGYSGQRLNKEKTSLLARIQVGKTKTK